jgi:hypothetical protein
VSETGGALTPRTSSTFFRFPEVGVLVQYRLLEERNVLARADGDVAGIREWLPRKLTLIMLISRFRGRPLEIRRRSDGGE